jgi:DNA-binding beta-propeller fold protein YncE
MRSARSATLAGVLLAALIAAPGCSSEPEGPKVCADAPGVACVWAGTGELALNGDGLNRLKTSFYWPEDIEFAPDGRAWVLDWNNHRVRVLQKDDTFKTMVGDFVGDGPGDLGDLRPPGAPGDTVNLNHPTDLQFEPDGKLFIASWHNHKIRRLDPETGLVTVMCGRGAGFAGDGGPASSALFNQPKAIARDKDGSMYVLDQRSFRIRKISPGADPTISTVVGNGTKGFAGDDGPPAQAQLNFEAGGNPEPSGAIAVDANGVLYISDGLNHRIRKVDFAANVITTIAGNGTPGYAGDGGPAKDAQINNVRDLEIGPDGRLYLADSENHRIRVIDLATGTIETVVGTGVAGNNGDGHPAKETQIYRPFGIGFDAAGNLFVADTFNSRVLKVTR